MKLSTSDNYIPSLDGFRAISILIVFFGHAFRDLPIPGGLGVTIFFFISGYLITTLLIREFERDGSVNLKDFYIRRLYRLMPPLLITMAIGVALVLLGVATGTLDPAVLASQIFFYYNYWDSHHANDAVSGLGILWSLSVEEHFYLIFPALFIASLRGKWNVWWVPAIAMIVLVWRTVKFTYLGVDEWAIYSLTDTRIDSILWGCFLAMLMRSDAATAMFQSNKARLLSFLSGGLILALTLLVRDEVFRSTIRYSLQGAALVPVFYYALVVRKGVVFDFLNNPILRKIGVYSYTFYLVHYVVLNMLEFNNAFENIVLKAVVAGVISVTYAAAMNRFVEVPIKRIRLRKVLTAALPGGPVRVEEAR